MSRGRVCTIDAMDENVDLTDDGARSVARSTSCSSRKNSIFVVACAVKAMVAVSLVGMPLELDQYENTVINEELGGHRVG